MTSPLDVVPPTVVLTGGSNEISIQGATGDSDIVVLVDPAPVAVRLSGADPNPDILVIPVAGPPGPPGAAGSGYTHTQGSPSASWIVTHNLGLYPNVSVEISGAQVVAEVVHSSLNVVNIIFASPQSGSARFV